MLHESDRNFQQATGRLGRPTQERIRLTWVPRLVRGATSFVSGVFNLIGRIFDLCPLGVASVCGVAIINSPFTLLFDSFGSSTRCCRESRPNLLLKNVASGGFHWAVSIS